MVVATRSRASELVPPATEDGSDEETPKRRGSTKPIKKNIVITIAPRLGRGAKKRQPVVKKSSDGEDEDGDDDDVNSNESVEEEDDDDEVSLDEESEEDEDDEFELPDAVLENKAMRQKAEALIRYIKEHSPNLETILSGKMRKKHRAELFEWFMIYENSMPMSEERMVLRRQVYQMIQQYQKEYVEYKKHKKQVKTFETNVEAHNDLSDLQYAIIRLETSDAQKEILYRKYSDLREKDDLDEEFYKLKGWLKQALKLPYDRIKRFPCFDQISDQLLRVKLIFDEELYGMDRVKEQLLLFIHGKLMNPDMRGCCLGLVGEPGVGKCLHPDTPVLLFDGRIRKARDLVAGDVLMGDDSTPRVIESLCLGRQLMYRVHQQNGDPYTVNSSHILTLYHTRSGRLVDMEISHFVRLSKKKQEEYRGVKVGVDFPPLPKASHSFECPPKVAGTLWASMIQKKRFQIPGICFKDLPEWLSPCGGDDAIDYYTVDEKKQPSLSTFIASHFDSIPDVFRLADRETRLEFLRGVIGAAGLRHDSTYYIFLRPGAVDDLVFLTRSLGLYTTRTKKQSVVVLDPIGMIQGKQPPRGEQVLSTYEIRPQKLDVQDYVGFMVGGNHRFLLGDFTVSHNTSIARCLAKVLEFPFEQISFGGVNHADFIKGFDFTYVGSRPGEIARCLSRMGYKNGIIFFDEYEKVSQNLEITSSLLHITDFSQNNSFRDNYFNDLTIDLSSVWFIYSMNELPDDKALRDRVYAIHVDGYSEKEKIRIASDYLFPKNLLNIGKSKTDFLLEDDVVRHLVRKVCGSEKGIRNLEKAVRDIINKAHFLSTNQSAISCSFMLSSTNFPFSFPVRLTTNMIDVFLKDFDRDKKVLPHFYS